MKKTVLFFIFLSLCLIVSPLLSPPAFAHPIDIASFVIPLSGEKISDTQYRIPITVSATIPEITTTLKLQLADPTDDNLTMDFSSAKVPLSEYLSQKILITSEKGPCTWDHAHESETITEQDLSLVTFGGHILCPTIPTTVKITDMAFITEYPYQTNILVITKNDEVVLQKELHAEDTMATYPDTNTTLPSPIDVKKLVPTLNSGSLTAPFETIFKKLLASSLTGALLVAFLVGFLHSFEAGHSKTILASLMLKKDATIRQGLSYSLVFTLTHIADILVFGLILLILNSRINIFSIIGQLNRYALFLLLWMAIYLFITSILNIIAERNHAQEHRKGKKHRHDHEHTHEVAQQLSFRKQLWMGFLTGIAPCVMGWSIFFLILTTRTVWVVIPVIISFGGGIYLSLFFTTLIVYKGKQTILNRVGFLATYSPLISATLLVIFSVVMILGK